MEETEPRGAIAREFAALALVALAAYGALSLACLDLGRQPNLGGPLGVQLAESLSLAFGYQSYVLMILVAALARRVWLATSAGAIVRAVVGGAILILALSAAGGFWRFGDVPEGGAVGEMIAGLLGSYLNLGGGYIVVILALVGGIALMAGRAPTDLAVSMAEATRLRGRTSPGSTDEVDLEESRPATRLDAALTEARITPEAPLVKRSERPRPTAREKKAAAKPRHKGGFRLPPLSLLDVPPRGAFASRRDRARTQCPGTGAEAGRLRRSRGSGRGSAGSGRDDVQARARIRRQGEPDRESSR